MDLKDYYNTLGVSPDADEKVIKPAFRQLEAELTVQVPSQQIRLARYQEVFYEATWIEMEF
jgi:hypothetical protein